MFHIVAIMVCRKPCWHPQGTCENTDKIATIRLRTMESDLFKKQGCTSAAHKEIMTHNASGSPFLRLPPEIRVRIYNFVLGGQQIWIGRYPASIDYQRHLHHGPRFYHFNTIDREGRGLDIRLLRVCRQVFTETALLPYALNNFSFETHSVRKDFEKLVRPGKKQAQRLAIGASKVCDWDTFEYRLNCLMSK